MIARGKERGNGVREIPQICMSIYPAADARHDSGRFAIVVPGSYLNAYTLFARALSPRDSLLAVSPARFAPSFNKLALF